MAVCGTTDAPYVYKWPNGSIIPFGSYDVDSGVCIFDGADCTDHHKTGAPPCCLKSDYATNGLSTSQLIQNVAPPIILVVCIYIPIGILKRMKRKRDAQLLAAGTPVEPDKKIAMGSGDASASKCQKVFTQILYMGAIALAVVNPIVMNQSIQGTLDPGHRVGVLFAMAFLVPFEEVFVFLEDTMTVRINYAMGRGDKVAVQGLFNSGVTLGLVSGLIAAVVASILASSSTILGHIVYPVNPNGLASTCPLVTDDDGLTTQLRPFFLLMAWQWPFSFINRTLGGVFLGAGCIAPYGMLGVFRSAAPLLVWFVGLAAHVQDTVTLLGFAYWSAAPITTLAMGTYLACRPQLREQYGLHLNLMHLVRCFRRSTEPPVVTGEFLLSSLQAMATDLCAQLSVTIGIYAASSSGLATAYKVAAMQSFLPSFGQGWILGISLAAKSIGPQFIAAGMYPVFVGMCAVLIVYGLLLGLAMGLGGALPFTRFLGYDIGETACPFASDAGCGPLYAAIFEGDAAFGDSLKSFAAVVVFNVPFLMLKALLQACLDFAAQAKIAVVALVMGFTPSILVAHFAFKGSAEAIYIAMYIPHAVMALGFAARLLYNCKAMLAGRPGPWSEVKSFDSISTKITSDKLADDDADRQQIRGTEAGHEA